MSSDTSHESAPHHSAPFAFPWHWEDTLIAGKIRPLAAASDPDGMLLDACRRQDDGEEGVIDPFWATTWRAASGLDRFLDRVDIHGKRVLEVGCGTGHAGIAAILRGAEVTMTDGVADPLHLVRLSLSRLGLKADVRVLRLGEDKLSGEKFPFILGSDVTYLRDLWPVLLVSADEHLAEGGELLLSDPFRVIGNEFREWLKDFPAWEYREESITLDDDPEHPIRIMRLTRRA
ncbi:class I SAM-dependent methyltransferase [Aporhodopirellula aestuarii]|uniref:Protein N-lysine methyltransferase family protein n=1 Tax=Aporhodopirellula aestuarii TaxID=2950107 RepID=A0ABT0U691_9BACT|nr:protein N-lysine methyltransferase family protein [Aporhodopirellula aestuarii]MCM2372405.1 protein N-lysine methyltransferase family protein [Aporhodopirellula aestuarii]